MTGTTNNTEHPFIFSVVTGGSVVYECRVHLLQVFPIENELGEVEVKNLGQHPVSYG